MKIQNVTRRVDLDKHQIIWQWEEGKEEMFFIQTLFATPPYEVVKKFWAESGTEETIHMPLAWWQERERIT